VTTAVVSYLQPLFLKIHNASQGFPGKITAAGLGLSYIDLSTTGT